MIDAAEPSRDHPRPVAAELYGALPATLDELRIAASTGRGAAGARGVGGRAAGRRAREARRRGRRS